MSSGKCKLKQDTTTHFRIAKIQNNDTTRYWQGCEATGTLSFTAGRNATWHSHFGRQFGGFLQNYPYLLKGKNKNKTIVKQLYSNKDVKKKLQKHIIQQSHLLVFTQRS